MMDKLNGMFGAGEPAELYYTLSDYEIVHPGAYVLCAVTGQRIPLEQLRYWNSFEQEAYASGEIATRRQSELNDDKD